MRKRLKSLLGGLVLSLGLTACGGDAPVKQSDIPVSESQIQESALESSEEVKEDVKEEQSSEAISLEEAEWIPEEFEMDDVVNIDYIAPTVHTGANEQCIFLWNYTEDDLKAWFLEKYGHFDGRVREYALNVQALKSSKDRNYSISKSNDATDEEVKLTVQTGKYNASVVHAVEFNIISPSQDVIVEEASAVIEMLGFGAYAEDIIHSDVPWTDISTENDMGSYNIMSKYSVLEYSQSYSLTVRIGFEDSLYKNSEFRGHDAEKFEYWDQYFSLSDYLMNCEFDTSSIAAFEESERKFILENFDDSYVNENQHQSFSYTRYDFGQMENVKFEYGMLRTNSTGNNGLLSFEYVMDDDNVEFNVSAYGRQPFEARDENRYVSRGDELTDAEIEELCETRYSLMKKLDSSIDWTVDDLIKQYRDAEFDEDSDKGSFEGDGYRYRIISNSFDGFSLYGDFEVKEE